MQNIQPQEVPQNVRLIDVREPDEFAAVHAAQATNIPLSEFTGRVGEIDTTLPVYVICKSGGRSARAGEFLEQATDAEVINVEGGTDAWVALNLPTE
ncbi:rhodanese-like domain-containing protein [Corynebacterium tapiri]|uniref:Rhodanese-like domain-containing protein n=1 Tax=Corynebacterium tapiri TaxID=1448266 RepID=A0A5C4U355_9CORY|nr:rhodanese-like domain-containing protein [Corynebacterium tapiri]TNL96028.1 rhodanese-like domain-containing protein [Corynebacterium tapiri]